MALRPRSELWLYYRLVRAYRQQMKAGRELLYVDKSHPNIWIAEKLKRSFPDAKFVGIERQPFATVASMLLHPGVKAWHDEWRRYPVPNRFLGISKEISSTYEQLPLESKCALRWLAHSKELRRLRDKLGDDLMFIQYEKFAANPGRTVAELQNFLQMDGEFLVPEVKAGSLKKWETQLDREMCSNIEHIVGMSADDFRRA